MGIDAGDTKADTALMIYITSVSDLIEEYCKRVFTRQAYDVTVDGNDSYEMDLEYPVNSFTALTIDGEVIDSDSYDVYGLATDGPAEAGRIKSDYLFTAGRKNVRLQYNAGYDTIPDRIQMAVYQAISNMWERKGRHSVLSESGGTGQQVTSVSFNQQDMPSLAKALLREFVRPERPSQSKSTFMETV